jgi:hypothetical protein
VGVDRGFRRAGPNGDIVHAGFVHPFFQHFKLGSPNDALAPLGT